MHSGLASAYTRSLVRHRMPCSFPGLRQIKTFALGHRETRLPLLPPPQAPSGKWRLHPVGGGDHACCPLCRGTPVEENPPDGVALDQPTLRGVGRARPVRPPTDDRLASGPARGIWREVEGTVAFIDISGFTAMSEQLSSLGRAGAEEVTEVMNATFAALLAVAYAQGGGLLKFGGDALLLLYEGEQHAAGQRVRPSRCAARCGRSAGREHPPERSS